MLIRRAFKFELKPDGRQACQIGKFCGCARYVYN
ncbi:helix-turn-helix domain-containing protein [Parasutterella excrementihominis]